MSEEEIKILDGLNISQEGYKPKIKPKNLSKSQNHEPQVNSTTSQQTPRPADPPKKV